MGILPKHFFDQVASLWDNTVPEGEPSYLATLEKDPTKVVRRFRDFALLDAEMVRTYIIG